MLRKSTKEERYGCLFSILGMLLGFLLGPMAFPPPPDLQCGLPVVGVSLATAVFGILSGAFAGMIIGRFLPADSSN